MTIATATKAEIEIATTGIGAMTETRIGVATALVETKETTDRILAT